MANRIAALKALYESGLQDSSDGSIEQSMSANQVEKSLDLESDGSIDLQDLSVERPAALLSSTEDSIGSAQPEEERFPSESSEEKTPAAPEPEGTETPRKPARRESATPRSAPEKSNSSNTPLHSDSMLELDESSLSTSLRASQLVRGDDAVEDLLEDEEGDTQPDRSNSGHWGVREMRRRTAAGISVKSTQQKIDQLTAERDDLKIEVDFHRRNMSPEDVGAEVITLRQEKLSYVRRLQKLNELVKGQDQALKTVNKQVKAWEIKLQDYEELQEKLRLAEERAQRAESDASTVRTEESNNHRIEELEAALQKQRLESEAMEREITALNEQNTARQDEHDERAALIEDLRADLQDAEKEIEYLRTNPESAETEAIEQLQRQVDEQHETIGSLQDALAAERLIVAEKDGELDRMDQVQQDSQAAFAELEEQLAVRSESETAALEQAQHFEAEIQRLEHALEEAHSYHDGLVSALKEKLSQSAVQLREAQQATDALSTDVDQLRSERDSLLDSLDRHSEKQAELESLNTRLNEKLVELVKDLKDEETARERADSNWSQRYDTTELQTQRVLETKNELIESLERQLVQSRTDKQQLEKECQQLQRALQTQDAKQLRRSEDQANERQTLETQRTQYQREAKRLSGELKRVQDELMQREDRLNDAEETILRLQSETKELTVALQTETRTRLGAQDRLELSQKALDEARSTLRASRAHRDAPQRSPSTRRGEGQHQAQLAERNSLLATVYETLSKALSGVDGLSGVVVGGLLTQRKHVGDDGLSSDAKLVHHHLPQFSDRLMQLVRRLSGIQSAFEQRARALERDQSDRLAALHRQHEARMGQLERIERSIKTAAAKQAQWRRRVVETEAELSTLQRANHALQQQLGRSRDTSSPRTSQSSGAPASWSVRLRELEQRVKEADERVKRERLGAREARARDEAKIRYVSYGTLTQPPPDVGGAARHPTCIAIPDDISNHAARSGCRALIYARHDARIATRV